MALQLPSGVLDATGTYLLEDSLVEFGIATTKYLKFLAAAGAASAADVAGVVCAAPTGANITGAKIGEFSGAAFEASLEGSAAVLKVAVTEFGGTSLTTADTPVVALVTATKVTSFEPATVIEE